MFRFATKVQTRFLLRWLSLTLMGGVFACLLSGCAAIVAVELAGAAVRGAAAISENIESSRSSSGQAASTDAGPAYSSGASMWSDQYVCNLAKSKSTQDRDVYIDEVRRRNASCVAEVNALDAKERKQLAAEEPWRQAVAEAQRKERERLEAEKIQRQAEEAVRIAEAQRKERQRIEAEKRQREQEEQLRIAEAQRLEAERKAAQLEQERVRLAKEREQSDADRLQREQAQLRAQEEKVKAVQQDALAAQSGKRIALVMGNASYSTRPLKNSRNDADDISRALKMANFDVIDLRDATLSQMRSAVRQFGDKLLNNDVGLVYYSGHGVEVRGKNYFLPVNADILRDDEIADQGLDMALVLEKMTTAGKGVNILIVDAGRDDPFGRSFRSSSKGLATMDAPRGTIIAYATFPGKVASDGDGRNSPYTRALVQAMQVPNRPIEQVFKDVRRSVQAETKNQQTPWESTSLSGDFYFRVQK